MGKLQGRADRPSPLSQGTARRWRQWLLATVASIGMVAALGAVPAGADHVDAAIIESIEDGGAYLEGSAPGLDQAIDRATGEGIAFVLLDDESGSEVTTDLAVAVGEDLDAAGSPIHTVVVVSNAGMGASSLIFTQSEVDRAIDASFNQFRTGQHGEGLETFTDTLDVVLAGESTATTSGTGSASDSGSDAGSASESGGGIGIGQILLFIAVIGGGFWFIRNFTRSRKAKQQAEVDMAEDRAEIKEQLKNNADRVISLGDRVIASKDQELIRTYEEASETYQEVSQGIDEAETPEQVDDLDDRIDHAEWQFEVIEAKLDGRPAPPPPAPESESDQGTGQGDRTDGPQGPTPADAPRPGGLPAPPSSDGSVARSPRTGRTYPRRTQRRSGGGLGGGGLGGALGGVIGNIILGGGLGGTRSRRSQRRSGGGGLGDIFGGGTTRSPQTRRPSGGGLGGPGGGVLQRGGSNRSRSTRSNSPSRSRTPNRRRSSGGRSFGRRSKGGRDF